MAREKIKWERRRASWDARHGESPILEIGEGGKPEEMVQISKEPLERPEEPSAKPETTIKKPEEEEIEPAGIEKVKMPAHKRRIERLKAVRKPKLIKRMKKLKERVTRKPAIKRSGKVARKSVKEAIKGASIRKNIVKLGSIKRKMPERLKGAGKPKKLAKRRKKKIKAVKWEAARRSIKKLRKGVRIREHVTKLKSLKRKIPGRPIKEKVKGIGKRESIRKLRSVKGVAHKHIKGIIKKLKKR